MFYSTGPCFPNRDFSILGISLCYLGITHETKTLTHFQEAELSTKNKELEVLRLKAAETPPELLSLRQELSDVKQKHAADLSNAEQRSREVEERAQNLRSSQENRVVNLEARLQELSETVGSYDRLRQQDQVMHLAGIKCLLQKFRKLPVIKLFVK